jgi:hypothetical protein
MNIITKLQRLFVDHPNSVRETYITHAVFALRCGIQLWGIGCIAIIHAFMPFLFTHTVTNMLEKLSDRMYERRCKYDKGW